ncbi:hypothetical protein HD554DRAFT_1793932 [Boletus coccyginus]|nr:hypothetical protein HD554DRAFT_1793932 [Boletus coccyginus]
MTAFARVAPPQTYVPVVEALSQPRLKSYRPPLSNNLASVIVCGSILVGEGYTWISDPEAMDLTDDQWRALVNALTVVEGGKEMAKKADVRTSNILDSRRTRHKVGSDSERVRKIASRSQCDMVAFAVVDILSSVIDGCSKNSYDVPDTKRQRLESLMDDRSPFLGFVGPMISRVRDASSHVEATQDLLKNL